jgi:hypothetical protein
VFLARDDKNKIPFADCSRRITRHHNAAPFKDIIQVLAFVNMVRGMSARFKGEDTDRKIWCAIGFADWDLPGCSFGSLHVDNEVFAFLQVRDLHHNLLSFTDLKQKIGRLQSNFDSFARNNYSYWSKRRLLNNPLADDIQIIDWTH